MARKWTDNWSVLLLSSPLEGMNDQFRGEKRVQRPSLRFLVLRLSRLYNSGMGGVDFMDKSFVAYRLDRKSSVRFYLRIFFKLMDIAMCQCYNMKHPNKLSLLDYKIVVAKHLIQYHQKKTVPMSRPSKRKNQTESIDNHG